MSKYDPKHMGGKLPKHGTKVAVARVTTAALIASMVANPLLAPVAAFAAQPEEDATDAVNTAALKVAQAARTSQAVAQAESTPAEDATAQSRSVEETQREMQGAQLDVVDSTHFVDQSATAHQQASYVSDAAKQQAQAQLDELQRRADELQGQLQDAAAKQAEYQKAVEAKDAAEQDKAAKDKALSEVQAKLDEAKQALDAAQAEANKLKPEELEAAKAAYEQAKAEADQAAAAQQAADKAMADAQTQIDALTAQKQQADAAVADVQAAQQVAQQQLASAQAAYDAAKQAYDAAAGDANADEVAQQVADAKAKLDAATTALAAAKDADAAAQVALAQANGNVESLAGQLSAAQAEQQKAQQTYDEASAAYGDKAAALEAAQKAYDEAKASEGEKQKAYEAAKADFEAKHKVYMDLSAKHDAAYAAYKAAGDKVDAINKQIDELRASSDEYKELAAKGTVGFMEYIQNGSQFTEQQKQNATSALALLKGEEGKTGWYDDYVQLDGEFSPMTLENLQNALTYMDAINNIRAANGLDAMNVNISAMAGSMLNACYSSNVWGHASNSGQGSYMSGCENLASGGGAYTYSSELDSWGWPFTGWYTQERAKMISAAEKAGLTVPTDETQMYQFYKDNAATLADNGAPYIEIGHYINFINPSYNSFGIGTGVGKDGNITDNVNPGDVTIYQGSWEDGDFTVAEFKELVNGYVNSKFNEATLQKLQGLQAQLGQARGESSEAWAAFNEVDSKLMDYQESVVDPAYEARESAKAAYEQAQEATAAAKTAYDKANADAGNGVVAQAKQALDAANAKVSGIQGKLDAAKKDAQAKKAAADATAATLKSAQATYDSAKATYDKLAKEHASLIDAKGKLEAAAQKLDAAKKQDAAAETALVDAQAKAQNLADKLTAAKADLASKKQAAADAASAAKRADTALQRATKDYQVGLNLEQATADHKAAVADAAIKQQAAKDAAAVLEAASAKVAPAFAAYDQAYTTLRGGLKLVNTLQAGFDAFLKQNVKPVEQQPGETTQATTQQTPAGKHFKQASDKKAASKAANKAELPQTGDANGLIGETFVIGGVTLIAAGVVLDGRRRRQN